MVSYKLVNDKGVSVHTGAEYYDFKPVTMDLVYKVGGVCGAQAKFTSKMLQAHGVPAMPVAQPGHCAILYRHNHTGEWKFSNGFAGNFSTSTSHGGITTPWMDEINNIWTVQAAEECTHDIDSYLLSYSLLSAAEVCEGVDENISTSLITKSIMTCPFNVGSWIYAHKKLSNDRRVIEAGNNLQCIASDLRVYSCVEKYRCCQVGRVPLRDATIVRGEEDPRFLARNVSDGTGSEFASKSEELVFFVPVIGPAFIERLEIQYWGTGWPCEFQVFNGEGEVGQIICDGNDQDPKPSSCNAKTTISLGVLVSDGLTVACKGGNGDGFGLGYCFGFRRFDMIGRRLPYTGFEDIPYTTTSEDARTTVALQICSNVNCLEIESGGQCDLQNNIIITSHTGEKIKLKPSDIGFNKIGDGIQQLTISGYQPATMITFPSGVSVSRVSGFCLSSNAMRTIQEFFRLDCINEDLGAHREMDIWISSTFDTDVQSGSLIQSPCQSPSQSHENDSKITDQAKAKIDDAKKVWRQIKDLKSRFK
eukprot:GHVH01007096.1.p1 GENE.GHVH01007096.1~~GHVH01007096.1.p1  ORF type:complete len:533 (+),score=46.75 GHVH01007096.1:676-2274(+)